MSNPSMCRVKSLQTLPENTVHSSSISLVSLTLAFHPIAHRDLLWEFSFEQCEMHVVGASPAYGPGSGLEGIGRLLSLRERGESA